MDNSMDINLNSGNNSMNSLIFIWKAFFSDGSILEQFENGVENRFQIVKDNFDKLVRFSLTNKDYSQCFTVDLLNGFIIYNNYKNLEIGNKEKRNIRLVFFRRHRVEMTEKMIEKSHNIEYHLGFQWANDKNENRKIILQIDESGSWILGD